MHAKARPTAARPFREGVLAFDGLVGGPPPPGAPVPRAASTVTLLLAVLVLGAVLAPPTPAAAQVPAPSDVLGFAPGEDHRLATYDEVVRYMRALADASDRVVLEEIGRSTLGRPMLLAFISSPGNLARRERVREINRRLSHARGLDEAEARRLAAEGLVTVWIDGGLHATEVAHGQLMPELAHWLAADEGEEARRIRDRVLVLLMPNINPDGLDAVADWYHGNLGTAFETAPFPGLYHHYVGHDNNRDWYMFTQLESRAAARVFYHEWFPQIIYNHHQTGPFPGRIWVPPPIDPLNPHVDPLMPAAFSHVGQYMLKRFMREGKPGVSTGIGYRVAWAGGFMHAAPQLHNMLGIFTETALYRYATPHCYTEEELGEVFTRNIPLPTRVPSMHYPVPWEGGCWRMRDAMDYMTTATRAVLDLASRVGEDFLYDSYHLGRRQIERGERGEGGPFAWVIDLAEQHDRGSALDLLRILRTGGVEIRRADRELRAGGRTFPAGSFVIGPQAYRPFVLDVLEPKEHRDRFDHPGGPPEVPYDLTGYNLPDQMGVAVHRVTERFPLPGNVVNEVRPDGGAVRGEGPAGWLLSAANLHAYAAVNRLLSGGAHVARARTAFEAGGQSWAPGTFLVENVDRAAPEALAEEGLEVLGLATRPAGEWAAIRAPRVALYKSWLDNMAEGWTRWALDTYGFRPDTLHDADLRTERLHDYDLVLLPDQAAREILNGHAAGVMPEGLTGGIGVEGAAALDRFVRDGGWLVAHHEAVELAAAQLSLPVRNRVRGVEPRGFFVPGTLVRVEVDPADPMAYGMPERAAALLWRHALVMDVVPAAAEPSARGGAQAVERDLTVFARFPREDVVADGWAIGAQRFLAGAPAGIRVPHGRGQVVLLGFRPDTRGQPRSTFRLLFNPLYEATVEVGAGPRADGS